MDIGMKALKASPKNGAKNNYFLNLSALALSVVLPVILAIMNLPKKMYTKTMLRKSICPAFFKVKMQFMDENPRPFRATIIWCSLSLAYS